MKKTILSFFALGLFGSLLIPFSSAQAAPFLATFRTTTANETITLPLYTGGVEYTHTYDFYVDWGDGSAVDHITSITQAERVHTYATAGDHQISITGHMPFWSFRGGVPNNVSKAKLISIDDAGDVDFGVGITNFTAIFTGTTKLVSVALFDTSAGTTFSQMFYGATALTTVPQFNTSAGTNFYAMFYNATNLSTIPLLDTSSGIDFSYMFNLATSLSSLPA